MRIALRYEEQLILDFLKAHPKEHFGPVQIARKAGGRKMFEENPRWAIALLPKMRELDLITTNAEGSYRYITEQEREKNLKNAQKRADRQT